MCARVLQFAYCCDLRELRLPPGEPQPLLALLAAADALGMPTLLQAAQVALARLLTPGTAAGVFGAVRGLQGCAGLALAACKCFLAQFSQVVALVPWDEALESLEAVLGYLSSAGRPGE